MLSFEMMSPEHLDSVMAIEEKSFSSPWSRQSYEEEMDNARARYIVASEGGAVVGYAGYWRIFDESHVTTVAVSPEMRSKGYGRAIMEQLMRLASADGATAMTLEVRASNMTARNLYLSLGFREVGVRPGYYTDNNEDAVIMWNWQVGERRGR